MVHYQPDAPTHVCEDCKFMFRQSFLNKLLRRPLRCPRCGSARLALIFF